MSTAILRHDECLFEGSVSSEHLIDLCKACCEHLVYLIRAPAQGVFTIYLVTPFPNLTPTSEELAWLTDPDRPSSFDFSLSPFFPSWPLHKMTSGSPPLIPAHKFQHQYLIEVPLPSSHGRSYHQLPLSCAPGTKVRITRNSSSYKLSCVYLEAVWIWLRQNISFLNDRSRSPCAVGRLARLVERAVWA